MGMEYAAILVAGVASFLLGWLWYGPLFGQQWMRLAQLSARAKKATFEWWSMLLGLVTALVTAFGLAWLLKYTGTGSYEAATGLALLVWLAFYATTSLGSVLWEKKSWRLWLLNSAYNALNLVVMALLLTAL